MDNFSLQKLALKCNHLTEIFRGVWSADNFPSMCNDNEEDGKALFQIVNTEPSYLPGKHWVLLFCRKKQSGTFGKKDPCIVFWDSLGNEPKTYKRLYTRIMNMYKKVFVFNHPLQSHFSNCCGLYCLLMAHHLPICENFQTIAKTIPKRMVDEHMLVRFVNYHYKTDYSFSTI